MTSEKKPFFSVVIPLYNKQSHVKETLESVFAQTFQDFEIVIVNDGSTDNSAKVVEAIQDNRIRVIHQNNAGVSVARNRAIKEANAEYIAFLDADDIWLPEFLETICELIEKFPDAGLYATAYKRLKANSEENHLNIQALASKNYQGVIPSYFKSITQGDNIVWTSATCIPRKIFEENNIWFPEGEKYAEDAYVWGRVAMKFDIIYDTKVCAIYQIEAENNTRKVSIKLREPHKTFLMLQSFRNTIETEKILNDFDKYMRSIFVIFIRRNIDNKEIFYAFKQIFKYKLSFLQRIKLLILIVMPSIVYDFLRNLKKYFKKGL